MIFYSIYGLFTWRILQHTYCFVQKIPKCRLFIFIAASLESARRNAADANYSTNKEERLGRGKRTHVSNKRFMSAEEEPNNSQVRRYSKSKVSQTHYFCHIIIASNHTHLFFFYL